MGNAQAWEQVLKIISKYEFPVVIVSAIGNTTRKLIEAGQLAAEGKHDQALELSAEIQQRHQNIVDEFLKLHPHAKNELIKESCAKNTQAKISKLNKLLSYTARQKKLSPQMKDAIAGIGDQISAYLLAQCGLALDMLTQHIEARKIIKTDDNYGQATPNVMQINQRCGSLETVLESGFIPIIGGYYGESAQKTITTLGVEGSDYTASLIGAAVHAKTIEIWTDVSGIHTGDPRFIPQAKPLPEINYFDATEMAFSGAKVLHPSTLKPAQQRNIPLLVKNIFEPEAAGTQIIRDTEHRIDVPVLSFKKGMAILTVSAYETLMEHSFLPKVFNLLEKHRISFNTVNITGASVAIALSEDELPAEPDKEFVEIGEVSIARNKGLISIIGSSKHKGNSLTEKVLDAMGEVNVDLISFNKEKRMLNIIVPEEKVIEAAQNIHGQLI